MNEKKLRILVISDTHFPTAAKELPEAVKKELKRASLCIHAGDFTNIETAEEISKYTKLLAVSGNMDCEKIQEKYPPKKTVTLGGIKIGVIHRVNSEDIEEELRKNLGDSPDIYIFGHTHSIYNKKENGKIYFNPGTPTDKLLTDFNSFGLIEIKNGKISPKIVKLKES